jgi:hypothetical protein
MAEIRLREEDVETHEQMMLPDLDADVKEIGDEGAPDTGEPATLGAGVALPNGDPPSWMLWGVDDE